jgi:hypothetical protein
MAPIDRDFKIKKWNPLVILHSLKYALLHILGVGATQVTHQSIAISNVKTAKYTIGAVGLAGCDKNFATADGIVEQVFTLTGALPAFARLLDVKTRTKTAFAHAATAIATWEVNSNVATIVTQADHGLVTGNSVVIAGMTETALNGTYSITRTSNTAFTFSKTHADQVTPIADTTGTATFAALALVAETGTSSSGNQLIASATIKAADAITAAVHTFNLNIAPAAAAADIFVSVTPDAKWNHITAGQLDVYLTYIDI